MDEWGKGAQTSAGATVMIGGWNISACMEAGRANLLPMINWEPHQIPHREGPFPCMCLDEPVCSTVHSDRAKSSMESCSETRIMIFYYLFCILRWNCVICLPVGMKNANGEAKHWESCVEQYLFCSRKLIEKYYKIYLFHY